MKKMPSKEEIMQAAKKAKKYISSPQGRQAINDILARASMSRKKLEEARKISFDRLHQPMTI